MMDFDQLFVTRNWFGKPVRRNEDTKFVRGEALYVDDLNMDCAQVAIARSIFPHARIKSIDTSKAEAVKGVLAVITGPELKKQTKTLPPRAITAPAKQWAMAADKIIYLGEPLAAVVAEDRYIAEDAVELIQVEYEPLPPVVRIEEALKPGAPVLFEEVGSNDLLHDSMTHGDFEKAMKEADLVIREKFAVHRYSSTPLEPWVIIARHDKGNDSFTVWANDQQPGRSIANVCSVMGIPNNKLRLIVPDSGGGFGIKLAIWPYIVILCLLSKKVDKPIKWVQTRREHLLGGTHAPDCQVEVEMAVKKDGTILGLGVKDYENDGSFVHTAGIYSLIKFATLVGCYNIKASRMELVSVATNKGPTVQNRGVGKPTAIFTLERMVDIAAKKLGLDPLEMRFKNFIQPSQMPYTTPSGEVYESGDYPECLRKALALGKYEEMRKKQAELRKLGRYIGIGVSCGIEPGTSNLGYYYTSSGVPEYMGSGEGAIVGIDYDGNANVMIGSVDTGQGHATTIAQVVSDMLGISPEQVSVDSTLDSTVSPFIGHSGSYSNKFNDVDLGAVIKATMKIRDKMLQIAAHVLKTDRKDLKLGNTSISSSKDASKKISFKEIATYAYKRITLLPENIDPGLKEIAYYRNTAAKLPNKADFNVQLTHSNSTHFVVVEVDVETGWISFLKYVIVHDCGNQINPGIVAGMTIGSTVHGIGATFLEEFVYDDNGQLLATTFMDYLKPVAASVPHIELGHMYSPCTTSLLGTKSAGEGGAIGSLAAVANAVEDALTPFGVKVTTLPLTPEKIMRAIQETKVI
jgi:CO/xanthine dehydrogenase Mo-binding subunit